MITFNHSKFVRKAIQGVFLQKSNLIIELVISDDCSTDGTVEIIKEEIEKAPEGFIVNFLARDVNVGVNENFINALNICRGLYIAICEGDDYWLDPNKLITQYKFLEKSPDFIMSFHDGYISNNLDLSNKNILNYSTKKDIDFNELATICYTIPTLSSFFKNIIKNRLPEEMYHVTNCDSFLFLFLTKYGKAHFHNEIINVVHVLHSGGIWSLKSNLDRSLKSHHSYSKAYDFFRDKRLIIPLSNFSNSIIIYAIKNKQYFLAFKFYFLNIYYLFLNPVIIPDFFNKQISFLVKFFK
jgi:glycosyltransferase involved in cell wall biosynthesis